MRRSIPLSWFCLLFLHFSVWAVPRDLVRNGSFGVDLRSSWALTSKPELAVERVQVELDGAPKWIVRLRVEPVVDGDSWAVRMSQTVRVFLNKGDSLSLRVRMRSPDGCKLRPYLEQSRDPYIKVFEGAISLTPEWKTYTIEGITDRAFSPGEATVGFHLGFGKGVIEMTDVQLIRQGEMAAAPERPTVKDPESMISNASFSLPFDETWRVSGDEKVVMTLVDAEAPGFAKAMRLASTPADGDKPWVVQVQQTCTTQVYPEEAVYFRAWLRSPDLCRTTFVYELNARPHSKSINQEVKLTPKWKEYRFVGRARRGFRPEQSQIGFFLGHDAGVVEIAGVRVENWGLAEGHEFDETIDFWGGREHTDEWREPALERIERIRKGALEVIVVDGEGIAVPGATVRVEQLRHHFRFGSAVSAELMVSDEPDAKRYRQEIERLYNVVVFESDLKWRSESSDRLAKTEKALEWLRQRHIAVRGHCLVWGSWKYVPASVRTFRDTALRQACQQHVTDYARRFHDKLYIWDVVNEARTNTEVWEETGWKSFADAFRWTADAAPDALRCYNDYAILSGTEETRAGVAERIQYLLDNKAPVDVLGIQAHMTIPLVPMDAILATLDEWAAFGKPLEITEFDLSCTKDLPHAAYFRDFMTAVFSHPKVESFLMWGFWEGRHWRSREGGHMFRLDWSKRPAQDAYEDLVLNQWWTQWEGATGAAGSSTLRAFYGTHRVTVAMNDRTASTEVQLAPGKEATVRLVLE